MMGWLPLDLHVEKTGLNCYFRLQEDLSSSWDYCGTHSMVKGHVGKWKRKASEVLPHNYPQQKRIHKRVWEQTTLPVKQEQQTVPLHIYTDASKMGSNIGYGWIASIGDFQVADDHKSAKEISIYHAEVMAILEALLWLESWPKNIVMPRFKVIIWSDSKSAVVTLNGSTAHDDIIVSTMTKLRAHNVELKWIKGHDNNTGNELADMLAKEGAGEAEGLSFAAPFWPPNIKDIKKISHKVYLTKWQTIWENKSDCINSRLFYPLVGEKKLTNKLTVKELQLLGQVITGHGLFKKHLRHWIEMENHNCGLCGEDYESSWHLWNLCPGTKIERDKTTPLMSGGLPFERIILRFFSTTVLTGLMASNEALLGS